MPAPHSSPAGSTVPSTSAAHSPDPGGTHGRRSWAWNRIVSWPDISCLAVGFIPPPRVVQEAHHCKVTGQLDASDALAVLV